MEAQDFGAELEARLHYIAGVLAKNPSWIVDFGETSDPYFGKAAAQHFQQRFGISLRAGSLRTTTERVTPPDGSAPFDEFICEAEFQTQDGAVIPARGSCGTDEKFVSGLRRDGTRSKDWGQTRDHAREFAMTRMYKRAIATACGFDTITWDDLARHGLDRASVANVRKDGAKAEQLSPQGKAAKDFLWKIYKGEQQGLTKEDLAAATTAVAGGFRKITELENGQAIQIAQRLDAQLRQGNAPAPAASAAVPAQQQATAATSAPAQPASAPAGYDFKAAFDELSRLRQVVGLDKEALNALVVQIHGGPWAGKVAPPATLDKAIAHLRHQAGEVAPDEIPEDPF